LKPIHVLHKRVTETLESIQVILRQQTNSHSTSKSVTRFIDEYNYNSKCTI